MFDFTIGKYFIEIDWTFESFDFFSQRSHIGYAIEYYFVIGWLIIQAKEPVGIRGIVPHGASEDDDE